MPELPPLLSAQEAAELLGKDDSTIHRWATSGRLKPAYEMPGKTGARLFLKSEVEQLKAELDAESASPDSSAVAS